MSSTLVHVDGLPSAALSCIIPANPDISGVGVRVAIYVQNFLSFLPAFWAISDGIVTDKELQTVEKQAMSILITAFAILISAIVQAGTFALSDFHAYIILSLSWMNNTNTFIYFLLYICYKSRPNDTGAVVEPRWKAWFDHLRTLNPWLPQLQSVDFERSGRSESHCRDTSTAMLSGITRRKGKLGRINDALKAFRRRIVLTLGSLHLTFMASFGIWMWSAPVSFEENQAKRTNGTAFALSDTMPWTCTNASFIGADISLMSPPLRSVSLAMYGMFLAPVLNLLIPGGFFLFIVTAVHYAPLDKTRSWLYRFYRRLTSLRNQLVNKALRRWSTYRPVNFVLRHCSESEPDPDAPLNSEAIPSTLADDSEDNKYESPDIRAIYLGLVILLAINVIFVADIETTIFRAKTHQRQERGESDWTFGQTLAILLLVLPIRDVIDYGAIQDQIRFERAQKSNVMLARAVRDGDAQGALKAAKYADDGFWEVCDQEKVASAFIAAAETGNVSLARLIFAHRSSLGIDLDVLKNTANKFGQTPLSLAAGAGHDSFVDLLLGNKAVVDQPDNNMETPLMWAAFNGHEPTVRLLLDRQADVNQAEKNGETALTFAARNDHEEVLALLLERGANANQAGNNALTPLIWASCNDNVANVELLLQYNADANEPEKSGQTPLIYAARNGNEEMARILLRKGAMVNKADHKGMTPLIWAARRGHRRNVHLFLDHDAEVNQADSGGSTPLMRAAYWGRTNVIRILLDWGANVDQSSGNGKTALFRAIEGGQEDAARLLLDRGADSSLGDMQGQTPLSMARQMEGFEEIVDLMEGDQYQ